MGICLVGYIAGRFLGKRALLKMCDGWKVKYHYFIHQSRWLVFKFENEAM